MVEDFIPTPLGHSTPPLFTAYMSSAGIQSARHPRCHARRRAPAQALNAERLSSLNHWTPRPSTTRCIVSPHVEVFREPTGLVQHVVSTALRFWSSGLEDCDLGRFRHCFGRVCRFVPSMIMIVDGHKVCGSELPSS